jgi:hypothetical protein
MGRHAALLRAPEVEHTPEKSRREEEPVDGIAAERHCAPKKTVARMLQRLMSTHTSVLVDSVGPPSAEVCRAAASFP